jgi:6-phosphogluconolactonase
MTTQRVYIGTYTQQGKSNRPEAIYRYELDASSGALHSLSAVKDIKNPSFLTFSQDYHFCYAVSEGDGGQLNAFSVDATSGDLTFINQQPTQGSAPCYISVDAAGRWALVANYSSGSMAVFPINADGSLSPASTLIQNHGRGPNAKRQDGPHAHCAIFDPNEAYILLTDLGIDQIRVFRFDADSGHLTAQPPAAAVPGAGPRHLEFHPNGRWLYNTNELNSTVAAYTFDTDSGLLQAFQTISMLPDDFNGENIAADIHIDAAGRFLYASNRGHDSIAVFAIDADNGYLSLVEIVASGGRTPRNFAFDLSNAFLLVANQDSNNVVTFSVDSEGGRLTTTGHVVSVPSPVCVKVIES